MAEAAHLLLGRPFFCSSGFEVSFLSGFVSVNGNLDLAAPFTGGRLGLTCLSRSHPVRENSQGLTRCSVTLSLVVLCRML